MQTRTLSTGVDTLEVSELCLGIMNFGSRTDPDTAFALLDRFREAGGTFVDTSNNYNSWQPGGYGRESEDTLARWLKDRGAADEIVIATKCGAGKENPDLPLSGTPPTNYEGLAPELVRRELTSSLDHLGVERVGVYYGHVDDRRRDSEEVADTYATLVEEGLVGVAGMSNTASWRLAEMRSYTRRLGRPSFGAWQQEHTALWPRPGRETWTLVTRDSLDYVAGTDDLTLLPYSPQQQGAFARPWLGVREPYDHPDSARRLTVLHQIAHELDATITQVVVALLLTDPAATVPIVGASTLDQLEEVLGATELSIPAELRARLDPDPGQAPV